MKKIIRRILRYFNLKLNTVYKKLVCLTLVCSLAPLTLISGISYYMAYSISKDRTIDSICYTNEQIALNITNRMEQVEDLSNTISFYLYSLFQAPMDPLSGYLQAYSRSKNNISSVKNTFKLFQINIFLPEDHLISTSGNGIDILPFQKLTDYNMTEDKLYEAGARSFWAANKDLKFPQAFSQVPKSVITCWSSYRNIYTGKLNYAFACHIQLSEFSDILVSPAGTSSSYVIDKDNRIIMHSDNSKINTRLEMGNINLWETDKNTFISNKSLIITQPIMKDSMLLVTQVPLSGIRQSSNFVLTFLLISTLSIIVCAVLLSVFVSKTFTTRLKTLSNVMGATKASENREILNRLQPMMTRPETGKDEIDRLAGIFHNMVLDNDKYFKQILNMSLQTEKLKFQLLQSQINPHFLFNTLNTIISCQALGKIELAQQTITNLSRFYRELLHDPDKLIPIEEELHTAELYLKLICLSKSNPITWEFKTDDGIQNFLICKFVLQPFIENAVIHAVADSSSPLHIEIAIRYEEDAILIQISDNGVGIAKDQREEIRETLRLHKVDYEKHYGIGNVNVRLIPYFAAGFDYIILESHEGIGTAFTIHLKQIIE
ncbi:MAG TPA: histidine kinase [Clostridiales bacterium]|nr:histidine kinase [Clostridiales bacterium]